MPPMSKNIHVILEGNIQGPFSREQVFAMVQQGQLLPKSPAWREGLADWKRLDQLVEFPTAQRLQTPSAALQTIQPQSSPQNIYVYRGGGTTGPFSEAQIRNMVNSGLVSPNEQVWHNQLTAWLPLHQVLVGIQPASATSAPVSPPIPQAATVQSGVPATTQPASSQVCNYCGKRSSGAETCDECCEALGLPMGSNRKDALRFHVLVCLMWGLGLFVFGMLVGTREMGAVIWMVAAVSAYCIPFEVVAQLWKCHPTEMHLADPKQVEVLEFFLLGTVLHQRSYLVVPLLILSNVVKIAQFVVLFVWFGWTGGVMGIAFYLYLEGIVFNPRLIVTWMGPLTENGQNSNEVFQLSKQFLESALEPLVAALMSIGAVLLMLILGAPIERLWWCALPVLAYLASRFLFFQCISLKGAGSP